MSSNRLAIGRTLIPRYFRSIFEGGVTELSFNLKHPKESFHNTSITLDCDQCTVVTHHGKQYNKVWTGLCLPCIPCLPYSASTHRKQSERSLRHFLSLFSNFCNCKQLYWAQNIYFISKIIFSSIEQLIKISDWTQLLFLWILRTRKKSILALS